MHYCESISQCYSEAIIRNPDNVKVRRSYIEFLFEYLTDGKHYGDNFNQRKEQELLNLICCECESVMQLDDQISQIYMSYGKALHHLEQDREALKYLLQAHALGMQSEELYVLLSTTYLNIEDYSNAKRCCKEGLEQHAYSCFDLLQTLCEVDLKKHPIRVDLSRLVPFFTSNKIRLLKAQVQEALGNFDEARECYEALKSEVESEVLTAPTQYLLGQLRTLLLEVNKGLTRCQRDPE